MSYLDRLQPASFKSVGFLIESHEATFSRRIPTHVYANEEGHYSSDLGRNPAEFSIEAYLIGDDYDLERDRLVAATSSPGPGELVHPYLGRKTVHCKSCSIRETKSEGRTCVVTMSFVEVGRNIQPQAVNVPALAVATSDKNARNLLRDTFAKLYSTAALIKEKIDAVTAALKSSLSFVDDARKLAEQGFEESVELAESISDLRSVIDRAANSPREINEIMEASLSLVRKSAAPLVQKSQILTTLFEKAEEDLRKERLKADPNNALIAVSQQLKYLATSETALILAEHIQATARRDEVKAVSEEDWRQTMNVVSRRLEELTADVGSLTEYEALQDLRTNLLQLSQSPDVFALPNLKRFIVPYRMPFLVAVHMIYRSLERAEEVQRRNRMDSPFMLEKGYTLEYLSDG